MDLKGKLVEIQKISFVTEDSSLDSLDRKLITYPIGYSIWGTIIEFKPSYTMKVNRYIRDNQLISGYFETSIVTSIIQETENLYFASTENSRYQITIVTKDDFMAKMEQIKKNLNEM